MRATSSNGETQATIGFPFVSSFLILMYNGHFNSIYKNSVVYPEKTKTEDLAI